MGENMSKPILLCAFFVLALSLTLSFAAFYMSFNVYYKAQNAVDSSECIECRW